MAPSRARRRWAGRWELRQEDAAGALVGGREADRRPAGAGAGPLRLDADTARALVRGLTRRAVRGLLLADPARVADGRVGAGHRLVAGLADGLVLAADRGGHVAVVPLFAHRRRIAALGA